MSETAENSGEEAGEGALDVEAGEMTDGGEDDYDEEGSHHLVRETLDRADGEGGREGGKRARHFGRSQAGRQASLPTES